MQYRKRNKPFSQFLLKILFGFEFIVLAIIFSVLYSGLSASYMSDYTAQLELQTAEFFMILQDRQGEIKYELAELAADNSVQVSMMLEMETQIEEIALQRQNEAGGVHFFIRSEGRYYPKSTVNFSFKNVLERVPSEDHLRALQVQRIGNGGPVFLFSIPIKRHNRTLGWGYIIYDPSIDSRFQNLQARNDFDGILYVDENGIYDLIEREGKEQEGQSQVFSQISAEKAIREIVQAMYPDSFILPWSRYPQFYFVGNLGSVKAKQEKLIRLLILLTTFVIALTIIVAFFISQTINRQITQMAEDAFELTTEDSKISHLRQNLNYDEFITLARAFNKLLESLREAELSVLLTNEQLEKRVAQRTTALNEMNIQLKEEVEDKIRIGQDLLKAKEAAEVASKLKSEFLANVSHEIRTPLHCIIGFCDILLQNRLSKAVKQQVLSILNESHILLAIINDLLDHSKIESGKLELESSSFDLHGLLSSVVQSSRAMAEKKSIDLRLIMQPDLPRYIVGDRLRLHQVLMNLVNNALKFTHRGFVEVAAKQDAPGTEAVNIYFHVADSGIGIPLEKQQLIFNSFTQADGSTTRKYGGTGLGITIANNLVRLMGGILDVQSKVNHGTTFHFSINFPIAAQHSASKQGGFSYTEEIDTKRLRSGEGYRLLLVEDYETNRIVALQYLENAGYEVAVATNGIDALDMCNEKQYDLVLMDLQMPRMGGLDACTEIRSNDGPNKKTPILALTANAEKSVFQSCLESGFQGIIPKPMRRVPFLLKIQDVLDMSANGESFVAETEVLTDSKVFRGIFDLSTLLNNFQNDRALIKSLVEAFIEDADTTMEKLQEPFEDNDLEKVRAETHRLRGGANSITAYDFANAAATIEISAKKGDVQAVLDNQKYFYNEYRKFVEFVKKNIFDHKMS